VDARIYWRVDGQACQERRPAGDIQVTITR
jgi:hypothetical protein